MDQESKKALKQLATIIFVILFWGGFFWFNFGGLFEKQEPIRGKSYYQDDCPTFDPRQNTTVGC